GALQPDVEEHQMRATIGDLGQCRVAVARGPAGKALIIENARDEIPNIGLVIDNQNITCHGSRPACQLPVAASVFVSRLVASAGPLVSSAGGFVSPVGRTVEPPCSLDSVTGWLAAAAGSWPSILDLLWPVMANRSRIQAPRWPGRKSDAS